MKVATAWVVAAMTVLSACSTSGRPPDAEGAMPPTSASTPTTELPSTPSRTPDQSLLDPELVFAPTPLPEWREHAGPGPGQVQNEDTSLPPGTYRLQVRCLGGSMGVNVNGRRAADVECARTPVSVPVCLRRRGLTVSAEWIRGPYTDLAWQVVRQPKLSC